MQVAENDDAEREEAARDHEHNHIRQHPRVRAATEYVWATGCLKAMWPVPKGDGERKDVSHVRLKSPTVCTSSSAVYCMVTTDLPLGRRESEEAFVRQMNILAKVDNMSFAYKATEVKLL